MIIQHNGLGQRVQQSVNSVATDYLLDMQPGLYNVLASTTGPDTTRFVKQGNRSLRQEVDGQWQTGVMYHAPYKTDGPGGDAKLGVRRSVRDADLLPVETIHYTPYSNHFVLFGR